jgi:hypothetical protein
MSLLACLLFLRVDVELRVLEGFGCVRDGAVNLKGTCLGGSEVHIA